MNKNWVEYTIKEKCPLVENREIDINVALTPSNDLEIRPLGYGDCTSKDNCGCPIVLEIWEGQLRLVVWADINSEDPTHIIDLENARESKRLTD